MQSFKQAAIDCSTPFPQKDIIDRFAPKFNPRNALLSIAACGLLP